MTFSVHILTHCHQKVNNLSRVECKMVEPNKMAEQEMRSENQEDFMLDLSFNSKKKNLLLMVSIHISIWSTHQLLKGA